MAFCLEVSLVFSDNSDYTIYKGCEEENMKKGFTLIELLVVVLIIGILSSVALPQYRRAVEKARATEAISNVSVLMSAIDRFILANGYVNKNGDEFLKSLDVQMPPTKDEEKGIIYSAGCYTGHCYITAYPRDRYRNYELYAYRYKSLNSQGWKTKTCIYYSQVGKGVCEGLKGLGWSVYEGS